MITEQLSKLIRNFLWQGGKGNQKNINLVSWDIVKRPLPKGGLQVRDPGLDNLALGGKILWKIFSNQRHLVSQVLIKKYLHGLSMNNMDEGDSVKEPLYGSSAVRAGRFLKNTFTEFLEMGEELGCERIKSWASNPSNSPLNSQIYVPGSFSRASTR
jgi:hypothetical protein